MWQSEGLHGAAELLRGTLKDGPLGPTALDETTVAALARRVVAQRIGPGIAGLALGQGLWLVVGVLPESWDALRTDRVLMVREGAGVAARTRGALDELARHVLAQAGVYPTRADACRLALAIAAKAQPIAA